MPLKIVLFVGSVRKGRMATRVATLVKNKLSSIPDLEIISFDPVDKPYLAVVNEPFHFSRDPPQELIDDNKIIQEADGYAVVCGEYNRNIPPACTAMMNNFPPKSFAAKPVVFINYSMGTLGGVSATMNLRVFSTELAMIPVRAAVNIPVVHKAVSEQGELSNDAVENSFKNALNEFTWYAKAMQKNRNDVPFPI